jgi:hypothetical protein
MALKIVNQKAGRKRGSCHQHGHNRINCPIGASNRRRCGSCHQYGHYRNTCPNDDGRAALRRAVSNTNSSSHPIISEEQGYAQETDSDIKVYESTIKILHTAFLLYIHFQYIMSNIVVIVNTKIKFMCNISQIKDSYQSYR